MLNHWKSQSSSLSKLWMGLLFTSHALAGGGTNVSPGIHVNEHWTLAGSPYCVQGDIQLSLVTIDPGVEVLVDGPYEIEILAALNAVGTENQPILFTEKDADDDWKGLKFQNVPPGSQLVHCIIEKSEESGLHIIDSEPLIAFCEFRSNNAIPSGGAIHATMSPGLVLTISDSQFTGNGANLYGQLLGQSSGGAVFVDGASHVLRCSFERNLAWSRCNQTFCDVATRGGAIYSKNGQLAIEASTFKQNEARATKQAAGFGNSDAHGGAVYLASGELIASNSVLGGNTVDAIGASGVPNEPHGAGFYIASGDAQVLNCTVGRNSHHAIWNNESGGALTAVDSSILYFNNADGDQVFGSVSIDYSNVQHPNPGYPGTDNINFNPVFQGSACGAWDLSVVLGSSCIDAGNPSADCNDVCFLPSLGGVQNDMGATGGPGACDLVEFINPADINRDGFVDVVDLLALLGAWGSCDGFCPADTNCDSTVDVQDLLFLLGQWG